MNDRGHSKRESIGGELQCHAALKFPHLMSYLPGIDMFTLPMPPEIYCNPQGVH